MATIKDTKSFMRVTHRYLGFFMAGIITIYAFSGILLIFRDTDFLKNEVTIEKKLDTNLSEKDLVKEINIKNFEILKTENNIAYFKQGTYNFGTGELIFAKKELPYFFKQMTNLHKAQSKNTLAPLNIFFGLSLFFFVISSFWMFNIKSKAFKKGLIFTFVGLALSILLLLVS